LCSDAPGGSNCDNGWPPDGKKGGVNQKQKPEQGMARMPVAWGLSFTHEPVSRPCVVLSSFSNFQVSARSRVLRRLAREFSRSSRSSIQPARRDGTTTIQS
jgi:hypothetical protein